MGFTMQDIEKNKVYDKAVEEYGLDNQLWVLIEELGELLQAIGKTGRARTENPKLRDDNHLAEETADVMICLEQLVRHFDLETLVSYMMDFKLRRLQLRLESDTQC
jgi:NTP pyrophosphatase (non-canonical NTP hydrolase)